MRIRITFSKTGALRYIGNLDLLTIWERAARRAGLPLVYSQGFHPQPKINLASALPLGFSSRCELVDLRLKEDVDLGSVLERLRAGMPAGIGLLNVENVDEHAPPSQTQLLSAEYEVTLLQPAGEPSDLQHRIEQLLGRPQVPRERRGKGYDLRPLIEELRLGAPGRLILRLTAREGATGRPEEVLDELGIVAETAQVERTRLIFTN